MQPDSQQQILCAFLTATAGLSGPLLGCDEEEIVLLAYALINTTINKVTLVERYIVKPRTADINENVISHHCREEFGITQDTIKTGILLENSVEEFDHLLSSHVGDTTQVVLVTDGQLPLRQCLHPEVCSKGIDLPHYYHSFFDLKKEFIKANPNTELSTIAEMLEYLQIDSSEPSPDQALKQIQDLAKVIQRLLLDGHQFTEPEPINILLEPGICSKTEEVDSNCVVRARGLPWQSSDQDIAKFFRGLNVAKGGVALCLSPQGRRNGEALVRFINQEHRDMALKRHKHHLGSRYIEVYRASGDDFVNVAGGSNNEAQAFLSRGAQVIIRMRGLPYDCSAKQVLEFFDCGDDAVQVMEGESGVLFVRKADGRATGDAFVLFAEEDESVKALSKHRQEIGSRYIELFRSTTAEVQQVLNRSMDPKIPDPAAIAAAAAVAASNAQQAAMLAPLPQITIMPQQMITSGIRKTCIRLRGLPYEAQVDHILEFLGEHANHIMFQGVHMVLNAQGQPSGEAFIQMSSEEAASASASNRHHRYMTFGKKQRYIEVFQCSGNDMQLVLTGGIPTQKSALLSPTPGMFWPQPPLSQGLQSPGQPALPQPLSLGLPQTATVPPALRSPADLWLLGLGAKQPFMHLGLNGMGTKTQGLPHLPTAFPPPAPGMFFLNFPRLHAAQAPMHIPVSTAGAAQYFHSLLPQLPSSALDIQKQQFPNTPAIAAMGFKRSWEQAFPAGEDPQFPGIKRQWPGTAYSTASTAPAGPHLTFPTHAPLYPAM